MVSPIQLTRTGRPWCLALEGSVEYLTGQMYIWADLDLTVRVLRGRKMQDYQGLFDEVAAALQFPYYFGENGNAFDECLSDLSWLPPHAGYVIVVIEGELVLSRTTDSGLEWLVGVFDRAATEWEKTIRDGQPWDRAPVPFHVVLRAERRDSDVAVRAWEASGATVGWLPAEET